MLMLSRPSSQKLHLYLQLVTEKHELETGGKSLLEKEFYLCLHSFLSKKYEMHIKKKDTILTKAGTEVEEDLTETYLNLEF